MFRYLQTKMCRFFLQIIYIYIYIYISIYLSIYISLSIYYIYIYIYYIYIQRERERERENIGTVWDKILCMYTWYNSKISVNFVDFFDVIFWTQNVHILLPSIIRENHFCYKSCASGFLIGYSAIAMIMD